MRSAGVRSVRARRRGARILPGWPGPDGTQLWPARVASQTISAPTASAISRPSRSLPGATGDPCGSELISSAWSSTSRAVSSPETGTSTSRGPAARKSGTSNPALRRSMLGTPSSSSNPWMNSASDRFFAPTTRTSSPSASWGLILRARRCFSESWLSASSSSSSASPSGTNGSAQDGQNLSSAANRDPQSGQTSSPCWARISSPGLPVSDHAQLGVVDLAVADLVGLDLGRLTGEPDDHVQGLWVEGEVDVSLRWIRSTASMRVVDRAELEIGVVDLHLNPILLGAVDPVAQG